MVSIVEISGSDLFLKRSGETILKNITLSVHEGEKILITGVNGSGKSTLLKAMTGFISSDGDAYAKLQGGTYLFCGSNNILEVNKHIIYIEQEDFIQKPFVKVGRALLDGISDDIQNKQMYLSDWLQKYQPFTQDDFDKELLKKRVALLSGGEKKFIAILQGLIRCDSPDIRLVLIDEPVNNLDSRHIIQLSNLINRISFKNPHLAWILISHCRVFTNITQAYEVHAGKLELIDYKPHNCLGSCNESGFYVD